MRVLHLGKYYPPYSGGMENFLGDLLPALSARGISTMALVHAHAGRPQGRAGMTRVADVPVVRVPTWGRVLYAPVSPLFPSWLNRTLREFAPDVLHLHLPNTSAFWALREPRALRLPWVIQWQSDVVASVHDRRLALAYPLYRPLEQRLLRQAHSIIATSPPYRDSSRPLAPWRDKCRVIPLGLDASRLPLPDPAVQRAAVALWVSGGARLLAVGRLTYYKGHEILIRALAEVPEAQLILIGEGGRHGRLQGLVRSLGLGARVHLLGHLPGPVLQGLLASCDGLCLPSIERTEAFGLVLLEAMHHGKPVISSDVPGSGMGWVVEDRKTGLLVPPGDVAAWIAALRELVADPQLRRVLGAGGKRRLEGQFTIGPIADQVVALYQETLGSTRP